jgi:hypothetical protein
MLKDFFFVMQGLSIFLVAGFIILAISCKLEEIECREIERRRGNG